MHILIIPGLIVALLGLHLALVWRQKHTQFTGPGRTERNVIGVRVWPAFAMKSTGLLFLTAGVITAMGALFHVNAVWLYGPYSTAAATSYSQPDWYIGFLEGSLRLFPPWETRAFGFMINNVVYSGVIIPGIIFGGLFLVPWIERRFTSDDREHHLLDRPRDAPHRTAAGAAAITFVTVLFLGGSQDVIAGTLDVSIGHVTTFLQIAAVVGPPIAYVVACALCRSLGRRGGPERTERAGSVVRDAVRRLPRRPRRSGGGHGGGRRRDDRRPRPAAHRAGRRHRAGVERLPARRPRRRPPSSSCCSRSSSCASGAAAATTAPRCPARSTSTSRWSSPTPWCPLLIVAVLFAVTFVSVNAIDEVDDDVELVVEVIGFQWQWQFDYPEAGVSVVGTDATTPELVLPADTSVRFDLRSIDVIHSFWIPGFRFKRDMFPGEEHVVLGRRRVAHRLVPEHRRVRRVLRARPPPRCASRCASSRPTSSSSGSQERGTRPLRPRHDADRIGARRPIGDSAAAVGRRLPGATQPSDIAAPGCRGRCRGG